jgi:hypothetical protein
MNSPLFLLLLPRWLPFNLNLLIRNFWDLPRKLVAAEKMLVKEGRGRKDHGFRLGDNLMPFEVPLHGFGAIPSGAPEFGGGH